FSSSSSSSSSSTSSGPDESASSTAGSYVRFPAKVCFFNPAATKITSSTPDSQKTGWRKMLLFLSYRLPVRRPFLFILFHPCENRIIPVLFLLSYHSMAQKKEPFRLLFLAK